MDKSNKQSKNRYLPFSVAMSIYKNDNPKWFDRALRSITVEQSVKPNEIVIVVDGPVPDCIKIVIAKYQCICTDLGIKLRILWQSINKGLGIALKIAVLNCTNELIARMDSDDISIPVRFEHQLIFLATNPEVMIVGGQIEEFIGSKSNNVGKRLVPVTDTDLKKFMQKRCPFNHMTVMFRKKAVIAVGNYKDWFLNEDYYLWIRLAEEKYIFANLSEVLVHVRVGVDMYRRRGGIKYFKSEMAIQKFMFQKKIISAPRYMINVLERAIVQVLIPNHLRGIIFRKIARK